LPTHDGPAVVLNSTAVDRALQNGLVKAVCKLHCKRMKVDHDASFVVAWVSIVLYGSLSAVCLRQASTFRRVLRGELEGGQYAKAKFIFFLVMGVSALFELPVYIGCVSKGGPNSCYWDEDGTHNLAWCFHLVATCGFLYCIISTSILWSDIIQQKDGSVFFSMSSLDETKIFFRGAWLVYCLFVLVTMIAVMVNECTHHASEAHGHTHEIGAVAYCVWPIMLVLVTGGCFVSGTRLQQHVLQTQMDASTLRKVKAPRQVMGPVFIPVTTVRAALTDAPDVNREFK
jgi:hypothetical protein